MSAGNERLCLFCNRPIPVSRSAYMRPQPSLGAAWIAGFCSPACQSDDAYSRLASGDVWWLKEAKSSPSAAEPVVEPAGWTTLMELPNGTIFETREGVRAVKSEYRYSNEYPAIQCILLASGEYAHFCQDKQPKDGFERAEKHNTTEVRELSVAEPSPTPQATERVPEESFEATVARVASFLQNADVVEDIYSADPDLDFLHPISQSPINVPEGKFRGYTSVSYLEKILLGRSPWDIRKVLDKCRAKGVAFVIEYRDGLNVSDENTFVFVGDLTAPTMEKTR